VNLTYQLIFTVFRAVTLFICVQYGSLLSMGRRYYRRDEYQTLHVIHFELVDARRVQTQPRLISTVPMIRCRSRLSAFHLVYQFIHCLAWSLCTIHSSFVCMSSVLVLLATSVYRCRHILPSPIYYQFRVKTQPRFGMYLLSIVRFSAISRNRNLWPN
jgi:hypothetical protein